MPRRRKVCIVVSSRASYGRVKSVMCAVRDHPELELQLIVGASALLFRFGSAIEIIERDGFRPAATVYTILEGETPTTMAKSTGVAIMELATLFENLRPDIVVTVADRFETIATAIAASYMNIGVAHVQGGEITGSIDESVRHAVTKLSHLHFAATEAAAANILRMGEAPESVHVTGCPSIDIAAGIDGGLSPEVFARYKGVGAEIDPTRPYLVVLQHPVTTEFGRGLEQIDETLRAVSSIGMQTVWLWPNVDAGSDDVAKGLRMFRERNREAAIAMYRNFAVEDYLRLIAGCACLVGNSSSALREGSFLGVPAVDIGTRQAGRLCGENVIRVGYKAEEIAAAIKRQIAHGPYERATLYGDGRAGPRIADILASARITIQKRLAYD